MVKEYAVSHSANNFVFGTIDSSSWTHVHTLSERVRRKSARSTNCAWQRTYPRSREIWLRTICASQCSQHLHWLSTTVATMVKASTSKARQIDSSTFDAYNTELQGLTLEATKIAADLSTLRSTDLLTMTMQRTWISVLKKYSAWQIGCWHSPRVNPHLGVDREKEKRSWTVKTTW